MDQGLSGDGFKLTDERELAIEKKSSPCCRIRRRRTILRSKFLAHRFPAKRNFATPTSKWLAAASSPT